MNDQIIPDSAEPPKETYDDSQAEMRAFARDVIEPKLRGEQTAGGGHEAAKEALGEPSSQLNRDPEGSSLREVAAEKKQQYEHATAEAQQQADAEIANNIDWERHTHNYELNPEYRQAVDAAALAQQQQQPQPTQQQPSQAEAIDPDIQAALANPKVRNLLEATVNQVDGARAQYEAAINQVTLTASAQLFNQFPELQGLNAQELPTAINVIARRDPERGLAIQRSLEGVKTLYQAQQQAQAEAAQRQRYQFEQYAAGQDREFEAIAEKEHGRERVEQVKRAIVDIAQESYGLSREDLAHLWESQPLLRTAPMQRMMMDAALYRMAQKTATANPVRNIPPVQKPGASTGFSFDDGSEEVKTLTRKHDGSLKAASALRLAKMKAAQR